MTTCSNERPRLAGMRRIWLSIILISMFCVSVSPVHAALSTRSFGYGLSAIGQSGLTHPEETMGGLGISLSYAPFSVDWFEPSLQAEVSVGVTQSGFSFRSIRASLGFDVFRTLRHPFQIMTNNPSMWSISLAAGVQFEFDRIGEYPKLYLSCTPIKLKDKDFWYEWFSPYMTLDFSSGRTVIDSWGVVLFRFSFLCI